MNKIQIYFIEKSIPFNSNDLDSEKIGGAEKTLINISNELAKNINFDVKVFNNSTKKNIINNVIWDSLNNISKYEKPDFFISWSDANLLSLATCKKKYLWSHSVQPLEKFIRKKQFIPFLINRPKMILEGKYHYNNRSFITSLFGKKIIKLAPDYEFVNVKIDHNYTPEKKAIFTTRSDRNLDFLLNCWKKINIKSNDSKLLINPPYNLDDAFKKIGVSLRSKLKKNELILELLETKVMLIPGHKSEVYCLAAEEAREMCVPIVTMGYGALSERVVHGVTGFIAKNENEFINFSIDILNNNETFLKLKKNLLKIKGKRTYKDVSNDLLDILGINI